MKYSSRFICILIFLISLCVFTGCKVRTYSVVRERPDRETYGNRGFIAGVSEKAPIEAKTRKTYVVEIESAPSEVKKQKTTTIKSDTQEVAEEEIAIPQEEMVTWQEPEVIPTESPTEARTYVVEKGDTLEKISQKMYGGTKQWKKIYDANKDKLKTPDKIFPGQVLTIP